MQEQIELTAQDQVELAFDVNGEPVRARVEARLTLADFLRERLALTGTHVGCEHGVCGACTVQLDGDPVRACLMFAAQANGRRVTTIEGLAPAGGMTPLQRRFCEHHAMQCGFCTPGMILTADAFLRRVPRPTAQQAREALSGNICRCTGYVPIVEAVLAAAQDGPAGEAP
ncbi:(2Fe-2S)-binding protein [Pigmentiphaga soli]|uniref:(2Fe-2S)-binding protein n=2 Tax=Pigmentiphaga soli TaxID=1007095 RepID=A0ABP8HI92_9BURK